MESTEELDSMLALRDVRGSAAYRDLERIARALEVASEGDFRARAQVDDAGVLGRIAAAVNRLIARNANLAREMTRITRRVDIEGALHERASPSLLPGSYGDVLSALNEVLDRLSWHAKETAVVARALKETVNEMVDQLRAFAAEVIRVAHEVGTEGKLGGQADVKGVSGVWKDLTDNVNSMASNLTAQVRGIVRVVTAAASGDLSERITVDVRGEVLALKTTINTMVDQLRSFASEVTRVAKHVGTEGKLGAQAEVAGVAGVWKDLTDNVNVLAGNLTDQVRRPIHRVLLEKLAAGVGVVLNTVATTSRTEHLLEELKASNAELARRTSDLEDKARQLARVSTYKTEFLANMSHELRTPLNSLLILARLLADNAKGHLDTEEVEYASTVHSSGQDLLALINQILDLSKIESGKLQVEVRPAALRDIAAALERMFRPTLAEGIGFSVSISPAVPGTVLTDPQRLQQVLKNLLSNAFKFTRSGRVELSATLEAGGSGFGSSALRGSPQVLAFAVSDTGIGIPREKHELVFEAFQQADSSTSRTFGGTGLGLTISRELARLLGGEIKLRSAPGQGSTFTLYLPLLLPAAVEPEPLERSAPPEKRLASDGPGELRGRTVLVVDDDGHNLFAVTSVLERFGVHVLPAQGARECFELLDSEQGIDLLLMDVMMPEIDGLEATRQIRRRPGLSDLPIVALTAKALPGDRERCLEAGCSDFAAKPIGPEALVALLLKWTRR